MQAVPIIGFVGFGEAGFHIAKGLRAAGAESLFAFDINTHAPALGEKIRECAMRAGVRLVASNADLARECTIILSVVTANQAANAATQTALHLTPNHLYADMNSVSPALKQSIAAVVEACGARFVEIAIMAPVPPYEHKVPLLAGGRAAPDFAKSLTPLGMNIEVGDAEIGAAAATKMCRSIVVKGMEALLTECVLGATKYGAADRVFASLPRPFRVSTERDGDLHGGPRRRTRRTPAREMEEVTETLRSIGVDPIMAEATARRMDWSARSGLKAKFDGVEPRSMKSLRKKSTNSPRNLRMPDNAARLIGRCQRL